MTTLCDVLAALAATTLTDPKDVEAINAAIQAVIERDEWRSMEEDRTRELQELCAALDKAEVCAERLLGLLREARPYVEAGAIPEENLLDRVDAALSGPCLKKSP